MTLEIIFAIFAIALLFAGYMAIGIAIVHCLEMPNRWLRIPAAVFWPITLIFLAVIFPFICLYDLFNED
jgi:hypothetical protein